MRKEITFKALLLGLLCIFCLSSCNDTDDVTEIFTGRTWKMVYITAENEHRWYDFPDVDKKLYESYDPTEGNRSFRITFEGIEENGKISGSLNGLGSARISGQWWANGKTNAFHTSIVSGGPTDPKDAIAKNIISGLKNASSYSGDSQNLYIYYNYNNSGKNEKLCISFKPSR